MIGDAISRVLNHAKPKVQQGEVAQAFIIRGATVDRHIKQKIWAEEYIDLACLLPRNDTLSTVQTTCSENSSTVVVNQGKPKLIQNFGEWFRLFNTFVAIYMKKYPEEGPQLMTYMDKFSHIPGGYMTKISIECVLCFQKELETCLGILPWNKF